MKELPRLSMRLMFFSMMCRMPQCADSVELRSAFKPSYSYRCNVLIYYIGTCRRVVAAATFCCPACSSLLPGGRSSQTPTAAASPPPRPPLDELPRASDGLLGDAYREWENAVLRGLINIGGEHKDFGICKDGSRLYAERCFTPVFFRFT